MAVLETVMGREASAQSGSPPESRPIVTRHTIREDHRRRTKILVVDDNEINRELVLEILGKLGFSSDVAQDGRSAVEAFDSHSYDLILMDCQMPRMDGFEATAEIRRREAGRARVPIIALTAHAMKGDRERCLRAGMDDYLSKPIDASQLSEQIIRWADPHEPPEPNEPDVMEPAPDAVANQESGPAGRDSTLGSEDGKSEARPAGSGGAATRAKQPPSVRSFDYRPALARCMGDTSLLERLTRNFADQLCNDLKLLQDAMEEKDSGQVGRSAHRIKGAAANLAAEEIRRNAELVEKAAGSGALAEAAPPLEALVHAAAAYREDIVKWQSEARTVKDTHV